jgi:hypothetical protein
MSVLITSAASMVSMTIFDLLVGYLQPAR